MEINQIYFSRLRNDEHFQFLTGFNDLIIKHNPGNLGIEKLYNTFKPIFEKEREALFVIRKNALTEQIATADEKRMKTLIGLKEGICSNMKHFNETIGDAATKLNIVLENYGTITKKNYEGKTAAINDIIMGFSTNYADQINAVGLKDWVDQLKKESNIFTDLQNQRDSEEAINNQTPMGDLRTEIETIYKDIIKVVNAQIVLNGDNNFAPFVAEVNEKIDRFSAIVNRRGNKHKDEELEIQEEENVLVLND